MALSVVAGPVTVRPELRTPVVVQLRARPARAGGPGLPEVVLAAEQHDALVGHAHGPPALDRLLVRTEAELLVPAEHRDPDALELEAESLGRGGQLERELDRPLLEVVADREVAEHLEERQVTLGQADVLDIGGSKRLLAGGQARRGRLLLAAEVGLEGLHAGGGEQHAGVVGARNERCRGHARVFVRLEERQESLPDFRSLHRLSSLRRAKPRCPTLNGARAPRTLQLTSSLRRSLRAPMEFCGPKVCNRTMGSRFAPFMPTMR